MKNHSRRLRPSVFLFAFWAVFACVSQAQAVDPSTWPTTFDGVNANGPYEWVAWESLNPVFRVDPTTVNAVQGGQEGQVKQFICRATSQDGNVHVGRQFSQMCHIGMGGQEFVLPGGYQILVNTSPNDLVPYLSQQWLPQTASKYIYAGGHVGDTVMRVCRVSNANNLYPGEEWQGKCNIGYGGREIVSGTYQGLTLVFDKKAWQSSHPSDNEILIPDPGQNTNININKGKPIPTPY